LPSVGSAAETDRANALPRLAVSGRAATETERAVGAPLVVYGETIKVAPCSHGIPDSTFRWEDIKGYLPPEILRAPKAPMSHEQIVTALEELSGKRGFLLGEEIRRFIPVYKEAHKDDEGDPSMELADAFNSDHGADALPGVDPDKIKATEKQVKVSIALICISYAAQGLEPQ
jgi:hypothetical protein